MKGKLNTNSNPIGVFDSGIGGLTVVKEIIKELPNESIIYLGDTARVPYGTRGKEVITKFALELTNFLLKRKVKFLVVACNTISATCLDAIENISQVPVLGVIQGAAKEAADTTKTNIIGVIGTPATILTKAYEKAIKKLKPKIKIITTACPLFVPLAEEGLVDDRATGLIAKKYLEKFKSTNIDVLVLGCTHYPVLKKIIQKIVGKNVHLIDSAKPTAKKLKEILKEENLLNTREKAKYEFFVTDVPDRVYNVARSFLGQTLDAKLKKVTI